MKCPHCSKDIRDVLVISEAEKIREKRAKKTGKGGEVMTRCDETFSAADDGHRFHVYSVDERLIFSILKQGEAVLFRFEGSFSGEPLGCALEMETCAKALRKASGALD